MTPLAIALTVAVLTLLWWAANPLNTDHIENDEATSRGSVTRTMDPSLPRTWDTLDAVPEDVERATGDYAGTRRKLARSGLCESGWLKGGPSGGWVELPVDQTKYVKNVREEQ